MFSHIHIIRNTEAYLPIFEYISADSGIFRIMAQLQMFLYTKTYSEPMTYSGIFTAVDTRSRFQEPYSGITQAQLMHILNLI